MKDGDKTHLQSAKREYASHFVAAKSVPPYRSSRRRRVGNRITFTSWILSLLLNALILYLLALLPQRLPTPVEDGLQVDMVSVPNQRPPKARVAIRPKMTRSSRPVKVTSPQNLSAPARTLPLVTHARHTPRRRNEPMLTAPDETMPIEDRQFPIDLNSRLNPSIANKPMGSNASASRNKSLAVDAPERADGWLDKLRGEAGAAPQAQVSGSGQGISGYYNIATVQHEDAADAMRTQALSRLVGAMNRWTNVHTQLLPGNTSLADPEILRIPLVYIAARGAFAFSEQERANLREYLQNGGTLLFSDISPDWGTEGPVANSIRFELWKILGVRADLRPVERRDAMCTSFFEFKKGAPLVDKKRGQFAVLRLDGRVAVFYDAAGLGLKWIENDGDEKWLRWGVNLIVHTLVSGG